jgi:hypothetical protein
VKYCILCLILGFGSIGFGQAIPTTKIHFFQILYTGEENESFESKNVGFGGELIINSKNPHLNYFSKGRLTSINGKQQFLDGTTEVDSSFTFYQTSFEFGGSIFPFPRKTGRVNLYLGVSGILSYNYLQLGSKNLTTLDSTQQSFSYGYSGIMGLEVPLYKDFSLTAEFSQRYETGDLVDVSNFSINGFSVSAGFGW